MMAMFESGAGFSRMLIVYLCVLLWVVTFQTFDLIIMLDDRGRDTGHIVALAGVAQTTISLVLGYIYKWYVAYRSKQNAEYDTVEEPTASERIRSTSRNRN